MQAPNCSISFLLSCIFHKTEACINNALKHNSLASTIPCPKNCNADYIYLHLYYYIHLKHCDALAYSINLTLTHYKKITKNRSLLLIMLQHKRSSNFVSCKQNNNTLCQERQIQRFRCPYGCNTSTYFNHEHGIGPTNKTQRKDHDHSRSCNKK